VVGATIVLTLIGRGELIGKIGGLPSPAERARNMQGSMQDKFREEEQARRLQLIASGEATEGDEESEDESGEADESKSGEKGEGGEEDDKDEKEDKKEEKK
jgi:hypothetical protein